MKVAHNRDDSRAMTYRAVSEGKEAINRKRIGLWAIGMAAMIQGMQTKNTTQQNAPWTR
jgi:hypothetical protein